MDRREFLSGAAGAAGLALTPGITEDYGALPPTAQDLRRLRLAPKFREEFKVLTGAQKETGNVFLYQYLQKEIGKIKPHMQPRLLDGGEGDCVGHAAAMACDVLAATRIHRFKSRESFIAKASVEAIYWGSRVEIGGINAPVPELWAAGSRGIWAANYLQKYGVLHRLLYRDGDNVEDLRGYDPARSRSRRNEGVPDWLEPIARRHPVAIATRVNSGQAMLDAVCAGQPVLICSTYAFPNVRDKDGFTAPYLPARYQKGWRRFFWYRPKWRHAMVVTGAIVEGKRKGGIVQNSHGVWNSGPQPYDMPDGAFAVETKYLDLIAKDWRDCWALSSYLGYQATRVQL